MKTLSVMLTAVLLWLSAPLYCQSAQDTNEPDYLRTAVYRKQTDSVTLQFHLSAKANVVVRLTDMQGNTIREFSWFFDKPGDITQSMDASALPYGSYVIIFRSRERFSARRLVVKN